MTGVNYMKLVDDVMDGNESALKAYGILKQIQKDIAQCIKHVEGEAFQEAQNWDEKTFQTQGFKFEKRAGGRTYSFKHIDEWAKKKEELNNLEAKYKSAASAYEKGQTMVDDDTGEVVPAAQVTFKRDSMTAVPVSN